MARFLMAALVVASAGPEARWGGKGHRLIAKHAVDVLPGGPAEASRGAGAVRELCHHLRGVLRMNSRSASGLGEWLSSDHSSAP